MRTAVKFRERAAILIKTGFFDIFGSSVINKIVNFLSSIVLVRILTKTEYGIFTYAWNLYNIVYLFKGLYLDSGYLQLSSERAGDTGYSDRIRGYAARAGTYFNMVLAIVLIVIGVCTPVKIGEASALIIAACFLPALQYLFGVITCDFRSKKKNREFAQISNLNTVLYAVCSIAGAYYFREMGLIIGHYLANIFSILFGRIVLNEKKLFLGRLSKAEKKELFYISIASLFSSSLSQILYILDIFVLGIVTADENVLASYKVATQIPTALTFIPAAVITYVYPYFAEHRENGKWCRKKYARLVTVFGGFNFLISFMLYIFAPYLIKLLYGTDYMDAMLIFRILAVNYFLSATFRILSGNLLVTQRDLRFNMITAAVSGAANILSDVILVPKYGSLGAATATVLVVFVSGTMSTARLLFLFVKKRKQS